MTTSELKHEVIEARNLRPGDRIEDGGSIGLVVKTVRIRHYRPTKVTYTDIHGWEHYAALNDLLNVRLPRESGLELVRR